MDMDDGHDEFGRALLGLADAFARASKETHFASYRLAAPPPILSTKKACPICLTSVSNEKCACGRTPVAAGLVALQTAFAYFAKFETRLGETNPFAGLLDPEGGVDPERLQRLATRYNAARAKTAFATLREAPPLLFHPVITHSRDVTAAETLNLIGRAQGRLKETNGRFGNMDEVLKTGFVHFRDGTKNRDFEYATSPSRSKQRKRWFATATPVSPWQGDAWYFLNTDFREPT